jgi:hypothetical protein
LADPPPIIAFDFSFAIFTPIRCASSRAAERRAGQKRTLDRRLLMSTLPPKADIADHDTDVRFVPKADIAL